VVLKKQISYKIEEKENLKKQREEKIFPEKEGVRKNFPYSPP